ncbi:MAG: tetratricopeptide repeat protein [Saprospiraceae bacterium]
MAKKQQPGKPSKKKRTPKNTAPLQNKKLPSFFYNKKLNCGLLLLFGFLLYANTLTHEYTQDDAIVIYDNMYTTQGIAGFPGLLKYDTFKGFFKVEGKDKLVSGGRYRPFTPLMFAVEWQLFKRPWKDEVGKIKKHSDGETMYQAFFIGHLFNSLYYGLTGMILYLLLLEVLGSRYGADFACFVALITSLIFIAHPIHTEAVANIKGRDEIMTLLGGLAALYFSWRAFKEDKFVFNIIAAVVFFIALLSKENAITFLAVVPLTYYFFSKASFGTIAKQTAPLVASTVVFMMIRTSILGLDLGAPSMELMNNPYLKIEGSQWVPFTAGEKIATIMYTLGSYVKLLLFPHPLTHDYYPRHIDIMSFGNWKVLLSLALYGLLAFLAVVGLRKKDPISYGILFFLLTTSIISNIVFPVGTNMSERFMFMPSVGFCFVLAILAWRWASAKKGLGNLQMVMIAVGVVLLLLSAKTVDRNTAWKDNFTLFTTDIETSKNSIKLLNAVGAETAVQAAKKQNETVRNQELQKAVPYLLKAVELHPTYKNAYLQLGNVHNYLKEYDKSIQYYQQVLKLDPDAENGFNNLGITYREAGKYYGEQGNMQKAMSYLKQAQEMRPDDYEVIRLLGVAYGVSGQHQKAVEFFTKAAQLQPKDANALWNLGNAWYYAGDQTKADEYKRQARAIDPEVGNRGNGQ